MANFDSNAITVLEQRYLLRNKHGKVIETPDQLVERVCNHVAKAEKGSQFGHWLNEFTDIINTLEFLPNSPTLMNAGNELGQLSGCFLIPVDDNLSAIMEAVKQTALIHKSGGGTGLVFSHLRPEGSIVASTTGVASGPISFMKIFDTTTGVIKQGGKRRGANIGILSCNHPDILKFVKCKEDTTCFTNFNISVSITDNFMKAVKGGNGFPLRNPYTKEKTYIKAEDLFHSICEQAWKTGEPGIIFIDTINRNNPIPEMGRIEGTNPCITGDTKIMVIGRGGVSIKQLAEEGKDVPVVCCDLHRREHVRIGRNPRKTGAKMPVYEVILDDGTSFKATDNHPLIGRTNYGYKKVAVKDVNVFPWSLARFDRYLYQSGWQKYFGTNSCGGRVPEHKLVAEFKIGRKLENGEVVHHKNFNSLDNCCENLDVMFEAEHKELYRINIFGAKNPIHRYPERNALRRLGYLAGKFGEENPNYRLDISSEEIQRLRDMGWSYGKIGDELGCSKACVIERYAAISSNHKVVSIRFAGYEDVYNITVDDFHSYAVVTSEKDSGECSGVFVGNCGEQPLLPWESCNLGSIDLSKFVDKNGVKWERLAEVVAIATRFLDDVIDVNKYPNVKIDRKTKRTRKIGLGVMGWADMLISLGIRYDSPEALKLAAGVMSVVYTVSHEASAELGKEKGYCIERLARRNAATTTIAPTGTLSLLAGCSSGIEPIFAKQFSKTVMDNVKLDLGQKYVDVDDNLLVTAHEVPVEQHIAMQSAFQAFTDNAVSKTINLPKTAKVASVAKAFMEAHHSLCKGITVYREGCREAPMKIEGLSECDGDKCQI